MVFSKTMIKTLFLLILPSIAFTYENIALYKKARQSHPYTHPTFSVDASKAVDGLKTDLSFSGQQCVLSAENKSEAMWYVDLRVVLGIHHITIYYRTDNVAWDTSNGFVYRFLGFSVFISNTTDKEDGVLCFKDDRFTMYTIPSVITLNCTHHGRYVIYYNNRTPSNLSPYYLRHAHNEPSSKSKNYSKYAFNELCEFEVYGCPTPKRYGESCNLSCSASCKNESCHIETGHCLECEDGYMYQGPTCTPCQYNTYGAGCLKRCGHCVNGEQCHHVNGACRNGCEAGYYSTMCEKECPLWSYGRDCQQRCSKKCYKSCNRKTGVCYGGCVEGWQLPMCDKECGDLSYGSNCRYLCGQCNKGATCNKITGRCPSGCASGFEGIYCNKTCAYKYYGPNCNLTCSTICVNQSCNATNGGCLKSRENKELIEGTLIAAVIGGSIGVLLVVIAVVVVIIYRRNSIIICQYTTPVKSASKRSSENTSHMPTTHMDLNESQYNEIEENVYEKIETELPLENTNGYEQLLAGIPLKEIEYVIIAKGKDNADGFKKELASLERGEQFSCDTGKLSVNCEKNRVQTILPYDHSRVILRRNMGTSDDYINANYISGAERKNEYIATQGPLKTTIVEFWEMVCQDQIQQIIMLTSLTEQAEVVIPEELYCVRKHRPLSV